MSVAVRADFYDSKSSPDSLLIHSQSHFESHTEFFFIYFLYNSQNLELYGFTMSLGHKDIVN